MRSRAVHFSNSAHLLDMFTEAGVRDFRFRMFTDRCVCTVTYIVSLLTVSLLVRPHSDHSITTRGANRELYEWMTSYLLEKWGKGGTRRT